MAASVELNLRNGGDDAFGQFGNLEFGAIGNQNSEFVTP